MIGVHNRILSKIVLAASAVMLLVLGACGSDGCQSSTACIPLAQLYSSSTQRAITVDSMSVYGIGAPGDSMIVRCGRNVSQFSLPLRTSVGETKYVIHYDQKALSDPRYNDTITLHYNVLPMFDSNECGVVYAFEISDYSCTDHLVDSMAMPYNRITNLTTVSVQLYMRTTEQP